MREIEIDPIPLDRLAGLLAPERAKVLADSADEARRLLAGRTVWNVNSTAQGGGVAVSSGHMGSSLAPGNALLVNR